MAEKIPTGESTSPSPPEPKNYLPPAPNSEPLRSFPSHFARIFFGAITLLVLYFSYLIIKPYLIEIFLALVLFFTAKPLYNLINRLCRGWTGLSSALTCLLLAFFIVFPILALAGIIAGQALDLYDTVSQGLQSGFLWQQLTEKLAFVKEYLAHLKLPFDIDQINLEKIIQSALATSSQFIYVNALGLVKGFTSFAFSLLLVLFITFFLFLDGDTFITEIKKLSPLDPAHNDEIIGDVERTIKDTLKGTVIVAIIQGVLGGLGFFWFGVPKAAFWGTVMIPVAVIPVVGTMLIWLPATLYLYLMGYHSSAVALFCWCVILIGSVDNLVKPYFMKGARYTPAIFIIFSIMGGIAYFGMIGFILGPLILSFLLSLLDIYQKTILMQSAPIATESLKHMPLPSSPGSTLKKKKPPLKK